MKPIKIFGLAATAVIAAMAFLGASAASANKNTQLCKVHTSLTCPAGEGAAAVHLTNEGVGKLLTDLGNVLCLNVLATAAPLALGKPQAVHAETSYTSCGRNAEHTNCTITVLEQPLFNLLKASLDAGVLTATNGLTTVVCTGFPSFNCTYDTTGIEFEVGANKLVAEKTPINFVEGSFFCPEESTLDGVLRTLAVSPLCKAHTVSCEEKDQVKSLHVATTKPPVLYNTVANVECETSLGAATVLATSPGATQKLDFTELTWKECHTQGAADNCTVSSKSLPTLDLERTALNLGNATTLGLKVSIDCTVLDLIELDCVYGSDVTLQVEGALHKEGTGHGMLTASKAVLSKLEGGGHCPDSVKWDALYEPSEHVYVGASSEGSYILQ